MSDTLPIDSISVINRHRKDMGDIDALAESIRKIGFLHPIIVTTKGRLVAGHRRLEAAKCLELAEVPVCVASTLNDARSLLIAEREENVCRKDMTPSEKVALGQALEELERSKAQGRKAATQAKPGEGRVGGVNFSSPSRSERTGKVYDLVGESVGVSGPTYKRAKSILSIAETGETLKGETVPEEVQRIACEAREEMDQTGKVAGPYNRVVAALRSTTPKPSSPSRKKSSTPAADTARGKQVSAANKRKLVNGLSEINGMCRALLEINYEAALMALTEEECRQWARVTGETARNLKSVQATLQKGR